MKPYQSSNKITSSGLIWLLLSSVVGGVAIGGLAHLLSLLVYLIILFPSGMGFAGGTVMAIAIRQGKVRHPAIAASFGLLTGLILYGSMHYAGYLQFKQTASEQITNELRSIDNPQTEQLLDGFLQEETGATGFWGYVKYSAKQGVSIGRVGSQGANLGETGTWIYWLIELSVINALIAIAAYAAAKAPFCESCDQWYADEERLGNVNPKSEETFLTLLRNDEFSQAGKLLDRLAGATTSGLEVHLQSCPSCQLSERVLTVKAVSLSDKGNVNLREVLQGGISASQYQKFQASMSETMAQTQTARVSEEQIHLAQQERSSVTAADQFEPHQLEASEIAALVQQLSQYPIKEAYLVRKTLQYFPEKPFYILGIVRRVGLIESETAEPRLLNQLMTELALPGETLVITLNKNKAMKKALQQTAVTAIYQKR